MDNEQLPIRKRLRLWEHDYSQRGYYFLTLCTYNRQQLFVNSTVNDEMQIVPSDYPQNQLIEKWLSKLEERFQARIYLLQTPDIDIASSHLRQMRSQKRSIRYYVTDPVWQYIEEQALYL